jgi:two-component system, OmpR family, sensor kinase
MLLLLTLSTVATIVLIRQLMLVALDEEISTQFMQEQEEFRRLAGGIDPRTGEPFDTDLRRIFDVFFSRNVPDEEEAILSFVEGEFYKSRVGPDVTFPIERDPDVVGRWISADRPIRGELDTPAGPARYLAVPVLRGAESRSCSWPRRGGRPPACASASYRS